MPWSATPSPAQKPDLQNQRVALEQFCAARGFANVEVITEVGGGLNFTRKKFVALMQAIEAREVHALVIAHKDRLVRFGFIWFAEFCKAHGCALLVLNQELVMNESNIKIVGDKMFFLQGSNGKPLPPINFAACWNCDLPRQFIDVDQEIIASQFLILPITLHEFDQGYHLVLDFFRTDWMVQVNDEHTIPVPIISNEVTADKRYSFDFLRAIRDLPGRRRFG